MIDPISFDALFGDGARDDRPKILPEAALTRLREAAGGYRDMYEDDCRFAIGDIVTAIKGRNIKGEGEPHLVIFMRPGEHVFLDDAGDAHEGRYLDMRVLTIRRDEIVAFWVESANFKTWKADDAA